MGTTGKLWNLAFTCPIAVELARSLKASIRALDDLNERLSASDLRAIMSLLPESRLQTREVQQRLKAFLSHIQEHGCTGHATVA
jgi:hypothetical protein